MKFKTNGNRVLFCGKVAEFRKWLENKTNTTKDDYLIQERRDRVTNLCKEIDWAKGELLMPYCDNKQERLAKQYIDICSYELLDIDIN
jgi:hypothetical protein